MRHKSGEACVAAAELVAPPKAAKGRRFCKSPPETRACRKAVARGVKKEGAAPLLYFSAKLVMLFYRLTPHPSPRWMGGFVFLEKYEKRRAAYLAQLSSITVQDECTQPRPRGSAAFQFYSLDFYVTSRFFVTFLVRPALLPYGKRGFRAAICKIARPQPPAAAL